MAALPAAAENARTEALQTLGVVLLPEDLSLRDWPQRAKRAGLSTIALHHQNSPKAVVDWIGKDEGQRFVEACKTLELQLEYELHAMKELLPRDLFAKNPLFFRQNDQGERTPDCNCCVHSEAGLKIIAENSLRLAAALRPTTHRHFFWGDDGQPWCYCPKCKELSASEQALVVENQVWRALSQRDPKAQLAHLAYANTLIPPTQVRPEAGVFLEYAPINRRYDIPYSQQAGAKAKEGLYLLDGNLKVFAKETAQVLEYWLDVSRFSHWQRPAEKLPWNKDVFLDDFRTYRNRGIRHITSFAAWVDADYQRRFSNLSFIDEYGAELKTAR